MTHVTVRNGLTLAYVVAFVNAGLALLIQFGVTIKPDQQTAIVAFVNVALLLAARVLHLPEKTEGGTVEVKHVPVLVEKTSGPNGSTITTTTPPILPPEPAIVAPPVDLPPAPVTP